METENKGAQSTFNQQEGEDGFAEGKFTVTSANDLDHPQWFIYEYETSRKILVELDEAGKPHFIKTL